MHTISATMEHRTHCSYAVQHVVVCIHDRIHAGPLAFELEARRARVDVDRRDLLARDLPDAEKAPEVLGVLDVGLLPHHPGRVIEVLILAPGDRPPLRRVVHGDHQEDRRIPGRVVDADDILVWSSRRIVVHVEVVGEHVIYRALGENPQAVDEPLPPEAGEFLLKRSDEVE